MNREYLISIMEKANFSEEFYKVTLQAYEDLQNKNALKELLSVVSEYENGLDFFESCDKVKAIAEKVGVCVHYAYTVFFIFMAEVLRKQYIKKGYSLDMWQEFINDLNYQASYFKNKCGICGMEGPLWQSRFFNDNIFGFGILQFEIRKFGGYYKKGNLVIDENTPVLFVHVPQTGGPLDYKLVCQAYRKAEEFFTNNFLQTLGGKVIFTLRSWVMSEKLAGILKPTSNMLIMANDYDIFKYGEYSDKDADTIERIFGGEFAGVDYAMLPENTSLQRGVKDLLMRGEAVGWGWGVYKPHIDKYK